MPGPESGKNPKFFKKETTWKARGKGTGNEYKVFQQDIDWDMEVGGKSNYQRAKEGGSPFVMKDGVPEQLQLHHSRQNGKGPLRTEPKDSPSDEERQGRQSNSPLWKK